MDSAQEDTTGTGLQKRGAPLQPPAPKAAPALTAEQAKEAARMVTLAALTYKPNIAIYARRLGYAVEALEGKQQNVLLFSTPHEIIAAFRGSKLMDTAHQRQNFSFRPTRWAHTPSSEPSSTQHPFGWVHEGFYRRARETTLTSSHDADLLGAPLLEAVHDRITALGATHPRADIRFLGYSSGGAIAVLQAAHLAQEGGVHAASRVKSIMTFGAPRFGYPNFFDVFMQYYGDRYTRIVLDGDPVPHLPPRSYVRLLPRFGYVDGAEALVLPRPSPARPKEAEAQRNPANKGFFERQVLEFRRHMSERHGIHKYLQACTESMDTRKERFLRDLYSFAAEKSGEAIDFAYLPPLIDNTESTTRHVSEMLQQAGAGFFDTPPIPALARKSHTLRQHLHHSFFDQIEALASVSSEAAELLAPMQENPDLDYLRQYCEDISLEATEMQATIRQQLGQLAHAATSLRSAVGLTEEDVKTARKAGAAIKEWLRRDTGKYEQIKSPLDMLATTFEASEPLSAYANFARDVIACTQSRARARG